MTTRLAFLAKPGIIDLCRRIDCEDSMAVNVLNDIVPPRDDPTLVTECLINLNLVAQHGNTLSATRNMKRSLLLLEALEGGDVIACVDALRHLYPEIDRFEIVKTSMTRQFLLSVFRQRTLGTVLICSPWIRLSRHEMRKLSWMVMQSQNANEGYSLVVATRKPDGRDAGAAPLRETLAFLRSIGAEITELPNVHAKVYIRTPGVSGGDQVAVIGSENLTVPRYIELGVMIRNDSVLINKLVGAFYSIVKGGL